VLSLPSLLALAGAKVLPVQLLQLAAQELSTSQKKCALFDASHVAAVYATHVLSVALVWAPASVKPVQALQSAAHELSTAQKCFVPFSAQQVAAVCCATHVLVVSPAWVFSM
jgi:hypothetical protein